MCKVTQRPTCSYWVSNNHALMWVFFFGRCFIFFFSFLSIYVMRLCIGLTHAGFYLQRLVMNQECHNIGMEWGTCWGVSPSAGTVACVLAWCSALSQQRGLCCRTAPNSNDQWPTSSHGIYILDCCSSYPEIRLCMLLQSSSQFCPLNFLHWW